MRCPHCHAELAADASSCSTCQALVLENAQPWRLAQQRYDALQARYARNELDNAAFQEAHQTLAVLDAQGRYWLPAKNHDTPFLWHGDSWAPQPVIWASAQANDDPPSGPPPARARAARRSTADPGGNAPRPADQPPPKRHRLRGCCLGTLLLILVLGAAGVFISPLPQRWGLRRSPAERAFEPEPDRAASVALTLELEEAGIDTRGLFLYVLPYADGQQGAVLYAVLDDAEGFRFPDRRNPDAVLDYLALLAVAETTSASGVQQVAVDYRDSSGNQIAVLTAPTQAIVAFAQGQMSREDFMQELEGKIDLASLTIGGVP